MMIWNTFIGWPTYHDNFLGVGSIKAGYLFNVCTRSVSVNCSQCSSAATWPSLQCCFQLPLITAWVQIWVCHLQFDVRRWVFPSIGGSPVRYIDIEYRLSIYRHFWQISVSISISIWSFLKISISIRQFWKISISIRQFWKISISIGSLWEISISIRGS